MQLLLENPARVALENEAIKKLAASQSWLAKTSWGLTASRDLCMDADLVIRGKTYEVRLVYPNLFPDVPPTVIPRNGEHWSGHQYGVGGCLCLEYGPDNWSPVFTGALLLESAFRLLSAETYSDSSLDIPSRHALTKGQELRNKYLRFVFSTELRKSLEALGQSGRLVIDSRTHISGAYVVAQVAAVTNGVESDIAVFDAIDWMSGRRSGIAIVDSRTDQIPNKPDFNQLKEVLTELELWPWLDKDSGYEMLLVQVQGKSPRLFSLGFGESNLCLEFIAYAPEQAEVRRAPESLDSLPRKSVAIIGLGSVGSKIAVSLARAGVGKFVLVDDDILAPHNLSRHQLDHREVGLQKATAVEKAIKLIAPRTDVYASVSRLAAQESSYFVSALVEKIGACDVIVDATANSNVLALLSAIAKRTKKTVVLGEVFAGGYGGLMVRCRPGIEAPAMEVRQGIQGYMDSLEPSPPLVVRDYAVEIENQVFEASDADVSQVAVAMTQFVLDSFQEPAKSAFPYPAYLMGFRQGWIFSQPFETHPLTVLMAEASSVEDAPVDFNNPLLAEVFTGVLGDLSANAQPTK